jgi:hypothetical protein
MLLRIRIAMRQTKSFLQRLLSDSRSGDVSSKRVIGVVGFVSLMAMMFINSLYPKSIAPDEHLVSAIEYIVIAAMFSTTADKFSPTSKKKNDDNQPVV